MPLVGIGTWQLSGASGYNALRRALDVGYRHIDTATMYLNEAVVGRAVRDSGVPRGELFITTKLPPAKVGRERQTLEESLHDLGTEYVDLWLIHWPPRDGASPPTWQQFLHAREANKVRAVGVSNYSTRQIDELVSASGEAPEVNQIRWGPTLFDVRRLAESRERGVVLEGYSPFKTTNLRNQVLTEIAAAHGVTTAQVVLRWHLEHGIVVIPKSARPERIATNFDVFNFTLTPDEVSRIDALSTATPSRRS
jgi:diketogulonate reductase-like aldo/keto reductase